MRRFLFSTERKIVKSISVTIDTISCKRELLFFYRFLPVLISVLLFFNFTNASSQNSYYSMGDLDATLLTSWNTERDGSGSMPASFTGDDDWYIQNSHEMTLSGSWQVGNPGFAWLQVETGGQLVISGDYTVNVAGRVNVYGTLRNEGTLNTGSSLTATFIRIFGTYQHHRDGGYLPAAVWSAGSTCEVTGWTTTPSLNSSFNQAFSNFTWNSPGQSVMVSLGGYVNTVSGTFTLSGSGTGGITPGGDPVYGNYVQTGGFYDLTSQTAPEPRTLTITNNFSRRGTDFRQSRWARGILNIGGNYLSESEGGGGAHFMCYTEGSSVSVGGNFTVAGGAVYVTVHAPDGLLTVAGDVLLTTGRLFPSAGSGTGTVQVAGDLSNIGGGIEIEGPATSGSVVFNGTSLQTYSSGGQVIGAVNFSVNSGSILQMASGTTIIGGTGSFTLPAGATLGITSPDGIAAAGEASGNIQTTVRSFDPAAHYIYNGSVNQITGSGLPALPSDRITVTNAGTAGNNIVTLSNSCTLPTAATLEVEGGIFDDGGLLTASAGSIITVADYAALRIGGTNTLPVAAATVNLGPSSTVEYNGEIQSVAPFSYGNLVLSGSGMKTIHPGSAVTVTGDLTTGNILIIDSDLTSTGSLIVDGSCTGVINFFQQLKAENDLHLVSPPVSNNGIENTSKVTRVRGYSELLNSWPLLTDMTLVESGRGYNIDLDNSSDGKLAYSGDLVLGPVVVPATSPYRYNSIIDGTETTEEFLARPFVQAADGVLSNSGVERSWDNYGGGGWNLLGNPYPSAINITDFITANTSQFDPSYLAVYLLDAGVYRYIGSPTGWPFGNELTSIENVQAGQGFMVLAMNDASAFTFDSGMREHSTATALLKSASADSRWPGLQLRIKSEDYENNTTIVFNQDMTAGLDPGYDVGHYSSGADLAVYSHLADDNGNNFVRQALPVSGTGFHAIPIGVDFKKGGRVTFSAVTVKNGSESYWLEDRLNGIFTNLCINKYSTVINPNTYGAGRFYIYKSANTPTAIEDESDDSEIRVWASGHELMISGVVGPSSVCTVFDVRGQKITERVIDDSELNIVPLPAGSRGVFLVRIVDGPRIVTRKVAVL